MDKVQKIRAEIEKAYNEAQNRVKLVKDEYWEGKVDAYRNVLCIFDSLQEEPTTSVWHDISEKPKMNSIIVMNNDQTTLSVEYVGQSLCGVERWAYLDILLKL